jgi:hypothetical protein
MNTHPSRIVALALIAGAYWPSTPDTIAAGSDTAAATRAKDPAWRPATQEIGSLQLGDGRNPGALANFCLNAEGQILACFAPKGTTTSASAAPGIRVFSPSGKLLKTWPLPIKPAAVCTGSDGAIFVAGEGQLLKLDANGKVLASAASPVANVPVVLANPADERKRASMTLRRTLVTGLAATGQDVFMAVPAPNEFSYQVYRFDEALQNPKLVVEKLRGCCGQLDIQARDGRLWIPHNGRHAVEARDRDGRELSRFGSKGKVKAEDFGGCCEPKNMRVLANGDILVAESGPPLCIKRFSASGKFLGVVAIVNGKSECLRVTVEASPDGSSFYLLDTKRDAIRVFRVKG